MTTKRARPIFGTGNCWKTFLYQELEKGILSLLKHVVIILLVSVALILGSCNENLVEGIRESNKLPFTRLGNIPSDNDSLHAYPFRLTLSWDGGDGDGVAVGFYYRWDKHEWRYTTARTATFSFESPGKVNEHLFEVKAIDNDGGEDPSPPQRHFWTSQNLPPETELLAGPAEGSSVFSLSAPTETWKGIEFQFKGTDKDGTITGFQYTIDDTIHWKFISSNSVRITGVSAGNHIFYVRAVDDAQGIDPTPIKRSFKAVLSTMNKGILVVDETRDGPGVAGAPSDAQVDSFYQHILTSNGKTFDQWDISQQGSPSAQDIAPYSLIIWHADDRVEQLIKPSLDLLKSYLDVGGSLWIVGWRVLPEIDDFVGTAPYSYKPTDFGRVYFHLSSYDEQGALDFVGGSGLIGYPNIDVDVAKLPASFGGTLNMIGVVQPNDAETILTFRSTSSTNFHGKPCAVRYSGKNYKVVVFAFPFYFMNETQAAALTAKVLSDLGK